MQPQHGALMLRGMQAQKLPMESRVAAAIRRFDQAELRYCRTLNRSSAHRPVRQFFSGISRLGDGWLWYACMGTLPVLYGLAGCLVAAQMALTGALGVLFYRALKERTVRERPFIRHAVINCAAAPLDRYSFPSGHTLHAVCFGSILVSHFPAWTVPVSLFTGLVALSRVVLGLHYPTDVAAGALLGGVLALLSLCAGAHFGV